MKRAVSTILTIITSLSIFGQLDPVDVAQLTLKIGSAQTEEFYYGFAAGDQIVFNFEEERGKDLKEIEIIELPGNSTYMDFKTALVQDKRIVVRENAVYKFRMFNSSLGKRVCRVKIQRIPASEELISFNTNWEWAMHYDTTYVPFTVDSLIGYDTLHYTESVKELIETKHIDEVLIDNTERVGDKSLLTPRNSYNYLSFKLPEDAIEPYREEKTIAWAYWIGVGEEAQNAYKKNIENIGNAASSITSNFVSPLAGIAIGAASSLILPSSGDNVHYWIMENVSDAQNFKAGHQFYSFVKGNGVAAYGKNTDKLHGTYYIGLHNDNNIQGIDVNVKIDVIREIKTYEDKQYKRQKVTPKYVTLNKQRMVVNTTKRRVNSE